MTGVRWNSARIALVGAGCLAAIILAWRHVPRIALDRRPRVSYERPPALDPLKIELAEFEWNGPETQPTSPVAAIPPVAAKRVIHLHGTVMAREKPFSAVLLVYLLHNTERDGSGKPKTMQQASAAITGLSGAVHPFSLEIEAPAVPGAMTLQVQMMGPPDGKLHEIARIPITIVAP